MKSYVINLDRSPERLAHFLAQAQGAQLDVTRIAAVDGMAMDPMQRLALSSRHFQFQPLNPGELGVFMSHRAAWRVLVESGEARAAVFEDDALLAADLGGLLATIDAHPPRGDVIKLETTLRDVVLGGDRATLGGRYEGRRLLSWQGGTAGYVITRICAERLLGLTDPIADTVDQVLFAPQSRISRTLHIVQVSPAPCVQYDILNRAGKSATFATTVERRKRRGRFFRHGPWIDGRRAVLRLSEALMREIRGRMPGNDLRTVPFAADTGTGIDAAAKRGQEIPHA
ncbi:glycosyltransferase family 25 protein [Devosia sp.]|uniref:glycosyltransferase family 25 protein n=1 Tax=Devosia sp. TaxID=1871048 RepID=UPI0026198593|nr:glycosyltransferase family 25 protein [Devosia sp.]